MKLKQFFTILLHLLHFSFDKDFIWDFFQNIKKNQYLSYKLQTFKL